MLTTDLKRIIRSGYRNFMRSGFTSVASILIMTITLFVIVSMIFVQTALHSALNDMKDKVDVTVYFVPDTEQSTIDNIKSALTKLPEVRSVVYTSSDEALDLFKEKHADDYLTLQALEELSDNPLGASLNIKAKDPSQYESIARFFKNDSALTSGSLSFIEKVDYHQNKIVIDRLNSIIRGAQKLGFAVSLVLILISIVITFSTIRLIIYMSREEISVMRLVGAGSKYIRGPFVVSGVIVGLSASIATAIIFIPVSIWLGNQATDFIGINLFSYFKSNFFQLFIIMLFSGVILGAISSAFAVARYLKK